MPGLSVPPGQHLTHTHDCQECVTLSNNRGLPCRRRPQAPRWHGCLTPEIDTGNLCCTNRRHQNSVSVLKKTCESPFFTHSASHTEFHTTRNENQPIWDINPNASRRCVDAPCTMMKMLGLRLLYCADCKSRPRRVFP